MLANIIWEKSLHIISANNLYLNIDIGKMRVNLFLTFRIVRGGKMIRPQQFVPMETTTEYQYVPLPSGDIYSTSEQYE